MNLPSLSMNRNVEGLMDASGGKWSKIATREGVVMSVEEMQQSGYFRAILGLF